ncbi:MAG: putative rane protein [Lachnospiraceae bacterium]|jgi:hypothetical protein|nr:putative rane protein [Lachnospiraceae bacterium]
MDDMNNYRSQLQQLFRGKKLKVTMYVLGVLWISVIMQFAVNSIFQPNKNILEAFVGANSDVSSFEVEMAAEYGTNYLSEADKKELIQYLASEIGLHLDQPITINRDNNDSEVFVTKKGKNAESLIKVVSVEQEVASGLSETKHFIIIRLKLFHNIDSILAYRSLLEDVLQELGVSNLQTNMQITGNYEGKLSLEQMNRLADSMIGNLEGTVAYANRQEGLFTIYAYTGLLDEYVNSMNTKINIHVAISYDESSDITRVYLGTPVISGGY